MIEVTVAHLGLDQKTNTPVVILQEKGGERVLSIWIGPAEASAIAMELAGIHRDDHVVQIDARPSDSIAVALRLKAPIFTSEDLLDITPIDTVEPSQQPGPLDSDQLKSYLQNLDPEDFGKFTP
jgi:bifunctional DNase/RNase